MQRPTTGEALEKLGEVAAQGTKASPTAYTFLDTPTLLPAYPHTLYYRLRQVDLDGTASYSPVRAVTFAHSPAYAFTLAPSPAQGAVSVAGLPAGAAVTVLDALGRPVAHATTDADGTARQVLPMILPAGVYVVRGGGQMRRLVVVVVVGGCGAVYPV